jgi:hypothetical protein
MVPRFFDKRMVLPAIALVFLFGGSAAYLYPKLKIIIPIRMKYTRNGSPRMYLVPQKRRIVHPADFDGGFAYTSGQLHFQTREEAVKTFDSEFARAFLFENSKSLIVSIQKQGEGVLNALLGGPPEQAEAMRRFWGQENLQSEYAAVNFCLHATPDKGSIFSSTAELMRLPSMLLLKAAYSPLGDVIYQFDTERFSGFQFGNPQTSQFVFVYLFDGSGRLFRIKLSSMDQEEIDLLLASITIGPRG